MNPPATLMICDGSWGRMRREALERASRGIPSTLLVKVTPSEELRRLIRMIRPHPLIRQRFLSRKLFRVALPFRLALLLPGRRVEAVLFDSPKTFRSFAPWLKLLGIRCESL